MVELRARRVALLANRRLTWVFGTDDPGVVVREAWAGEIRLRVHTPRAPASGWLIVLAFHGGGWCWVSPLRATSHEGLPPALVLTARFDPMRSHSERYATALRTAGVEVALPCPQPATHAYLTLPGISPASRGGLDRIVGFLRERLG